MFPLGGFFLAIGSIAAVAPALAGDIYRCEGGGHRAFVDSPIHCPDGRATRVGGSKTALSPPLSMAVPEPIERTQRIPKREERGDPPLVEWSRERRAPRAAATAPAEPNSIAAVVPGVPRMNVRSTTAPAACAPLRDDATALRRCLTEERRKEVRVIANGRLKQVSAAAAELAQYTRTRDGLLAIGRSGRPPEWCEELLGDLIQQRQLAIVDNEDAPTPAWIRGNGADMRGGEVLDPNYVELDAPGGLVVSGYVTVRWKQQRTLVVRTRPGCFPAGSNSIKAVCGAQRYNAIDVHDDEMPQSCDIGFYERPYWPQWKDKNVELRIRSPR